MKIFLNGTRYRGNLYQQIKRKLNYIARKLAIIFMGTIATIFMVYVVNTETIVYIQPTNTSQTPVNTLEVKISELTNELLDTLQACESGGLTEDDGLITFDPNPNRDSVQKPSIGLYQFKKSTVQYYHKDDLTGRQAIEIALSAELSRELAHHIIFNTDNGLDNWYNCASSRGLYQDLEFINKLIR